ncbi:glycosyltransferase family 2 protein [Rufibacter sediminis]|uniref:Glycosyltransferase family 2 protein n=1 Tax=Rufibacter sediminis TaxID=2762756 RepID=A0ABR6VPH4_9BACT|nr:glycosyltransferase family 2 protein [Rufibacter sediminis]MBC3538506.1 glycosyltransferase family 2 protein [Rufibacter sediminis]
MKKLSIVIPTYNRGGKIKTTLDSLKAQTFTDFEVIIVNDGSTDNTREVLDNLSLQYAYAIQVIHQENLGRSGARNSGFAAATAPIVVSFDDDMRLEPQCLEEHYKHHQALPGSIQVGEVKEDPNLAETDIQRFLAHVRVGWLKVLHEAEMPMRRENTYITSANFSISKLDFDRIGGFDPRLRAIVDYDLAMRATVLGIPIYYNKNAFAWHDDFISCRPYILRRRQGTENEKLLMSLKPELVSMFHRYKEDSPAGIKLFIYSLLGNKLLVDSIDKYNFFQWLLPEKIRYKLYAAIITSLAKYFPERPI